MATTKTAIPTRKAPAPILAGVGAGLAAAGWSNGLHLAAFAAGAVLGMVAALLVGRFSAAALSGQVQWRTMWALSGGTFGLLIGLLRTPLSQWPAFNWTGILVSVCLMAGIGALFGPTPKQR